LSGVRTFAGRATASVGYRLVRLSGRIQRPPEQALTKGTEGEPAERTLEGDRDIEWSWCLAHLPRNPGRVLDFGSGNGFLSLGAFLLGHDVVAVDLEPRQFAYCGDSIDYRRGDFNEMTFPPESFDHIVNCSSIEHVGLPGRYATIDEPDGDLRAMERMSHILRRDGDMSLAVPIGEDGVHLPWHRVYGHERLPQLLERYAIRKERFFAKVRSNLWEPVCRGAALAEPGSASYYALGLFVLAPR
jgi:SAM-dependent methyltransferase